MSARHVVPLVLGAVLAAPLAFAGCFINPNPPNPHEQSGSPTAPGREVLEREPPDASDAAVTP